MPVGANVFNRLESLLDKAIENARKNGYEKGRKEGYEKGRIESYEKGLKEGRINGIKAAAEIADSYNSSTIHRAMLGDCILAKLNVSKKKELRPNKRRIVQYNSDGLGSPHTGNTAVCADGKVY